LIENRDLTSLIRVNPLLLFFRSPLLFIPLPWYFRDNVRGGTALQLCTRRGYTRYHCLVFRKSWLHGQPSLPGRCGSYQCPFSFW
jgi:hypothetical protein